MTNNADDRFYSKVGPPDADGCWPWLGCHDRGYGKFWLGGRTLAAHRLAYERWREPIPAGMHLDHLCRNRGCVNPFHLEPVTIGENVLRGEGRSAVNARKTHCDRGHELVGDNLYMRPDRTQRACVACQRDAVRAWRAREVSA